MSEEENLNLDGQPSEEETKETGSQGDISLEDLNKILGKEFKDKDTALKSLKDTQDFVGKKGNELKEAKDKLADSPDLLKEVQALKRENELNTFYRDNPEMDNPQTRKLIDKFGSPTEALENEDFKAINDPILAYNKANQSKSIIHKNSRLGQVTNKVDESKQSLDEAYNKSASGDVIGANKAYDTAKNTAVEAVLNVVEEK